MSVPASIDLSSGGAQTLTVTNIGVGDAAGRLAPINGGDGLSYGATIPDNGVLPFEVGGALSFTGYPPTGTYTGTIIVSVDYN